ncbi:conjugal transfer protein TraF [Legionella pneumophila]|uniref:conjugal transfer protein TraF n=1 Tax=Legionella pneumophila TaxID=446 RepID=UPI0007706F58|nr:conjugal transfer protein TraF [Legionella pneumophila]CZP44927.1 conjugal pilus assembly protein TraF [Legionella pneumophila]
MRIKWSLLVILGLLSCSSFALNHEEKVITQLAQRQGFFFFFSSSCPHCQRFSPVLKQMAQRYGFQVVAISMDGGYLPEFNNAVLDEGQSKLFKVTVYPSLFLVDPKREKAHLVTEGAIGAEELLQRLIKISQSNREQVTL